MICILLPLFLFAILQAARLRFLVVFKGANLSPVAIITITRFTHSFLKYCSFFLTFVLILAEYLPFVITFADTALLHDLAANLFQMIIQGISFNFHCTFFARYLFERTYLIKVLH